MVKSIGNGIDLFVFLIELFKNACKYTNFIELLKYLGMIKK